MSAVMGAQERRRISVVVPFYNVERYLGDCVAALRAQSYPRCDYEIILVDNATTDRSAEIAGRFDDVTVLRQPVPGSYSARNMGIQAACGEIIATIDPDCRADPDWLEQIAEAMKDPGCQILLGHQAHASSSEALKLLELYEAEKISYVTNTGQRELYFGYTNNMAFRRMVFDSIGLFPERTRGGDTIFVRRAVDKLGPDAVRYVPSMKMTHLELGTVNAYYNKRLIYGQSNERISEILPFRSLRNRERWTVFRNLTRRHKLSLRKKLMLLALLAPGVLLYESGRRKGMLSRLRGH